MYHLNTSKGDLSIQIERKILWCFIRLMKMFSGVAKDYVLLGAKSTKNAGVPIKMCRIFVLNSF